MSFKFLIDECLTPSLVDLAREAGFLESTCVRDRGWSGTKDWELMKHALAEDFTLVTHNSKDFRGAGSHSPGGLFAKEPIHAGLVCLNCESPDGMDLGKQRELFKLALQKLANKADLVNQAFEVFEDGDGTVTTAVYSIPLEPPEA